MVKTAVLVSGGGTNLQAVMDAHLFGEIPNCELTAVISSDPEAHALVRAESANIPSYVVDAAMFPNQASYNIALLQKLKDLDIELVVLAGYAPPVSGILLRAYENRVLNTWASLLPAFGDAEEPCGAALKAGVKLSGATAYFVTEGFGGPIILQQAVVVREDDTPASLQRRIMEEAEWQILPKAVALFCQGRLKTDGSVVRITEI